MPTLAQLWATYTPKLPPTPKTEDTTDETDRGSPIELVFDLGDSLWPTRGSNISMSFSALPWHRGPRAKHVKGKGTNFPK